MKKIIATILVIALSAICLAGCGYIDEKGNFVDITEDADSSSTSNSDSKKSTVVNTETAKNNVANMLFGDDSEEDLEKLNEKVDKVVCHTRRSMDELRGNIAYNANQIANNKAAIDAQVAEYNNFKTVEFPNVIKEIKDTIETIKEKIEFNSKSIAYVINRLNWQDFSIKKLAEQVKALWEEVTTIGGRVDALETGLEQEIADRTTADGTINGRIDNVDAARIANYNELNGKISIEAGARESADSALTDRADTERTRRKEEDAKLDERVTALEKAEGVE